MFAIAAPILTLLLQLLNLIMGGDASAFGNSLNTVNSRNTGNTGDTEGTGAAKDSSDPVSQNLQELDAK